MRKLLLIFAATILSGCCIISQIPTQYVYLDTACVAILPDYKDMVVVTDNCRVETVTQTPSPGSQISETATVTIQAADWFGNSTDITFNVLVLDTIAPTIQLDTTWTGYTDQEVMDMYRTFYGWVQWNVGKFVEVLPAFDTIAVRRLIFNGDTLSHEVIFNNSITYPDTLRADWYWATSQ